MVLLLYGFSCDVLGDVLDVKPERGVFSTWAITASFSVLCSLLRCGVSAQNGKVVNVVHGHLPGIFFQHRLDGGGSGPWGPMPPLCAWVGGALRPRRRMADAGSFNESVCKPRVGWRWALTRPP
jgi:hypothetical protein